MGVDRDGRGRHLTARTLRVLHRWLGLFSAPPLIITAICGALLLLRKTGLYERKGAFRQAIQALHSFEIILPYVGLIACGLMLAVTITGLLLVLRIPRPARPSAPPAA